MEDRQILFVVGAGASCEFGLPSGRLLLSQIASSVSVLSFGHEEHIKVDEQIDRAINQLILEEGLPPISQRHDEYRKHAAWLARNAPLAPSIDNLLHTHQSNRNLVKIGKVLIAHCLLTAENESCLYREPRSRDRTFFLYRDKHVTSANGDKKVYSAQHSWLGRLFWLLAEESDYRKFLTKLQNITFVSFNYDRCIEHYLSHAAASYFDLQSSEIEEVLASVHIIHPYGSLGNLNVSGNFVEGFGSKESVFTAAKGIRTFTEGVEEDRIAQSIAKAFSEASEVYFLGFGFLKQNLDLLISGANPVNISRVFGTSSGLSSDSTEILEKFIRGTLEKNYKRMNDARSKEVESNTTVKLHNMLCKEFMDHFHFHMRKL
jgi:hypothetical protein